MALGGYWGFLLVGTGVLALVSVLLGGVNVFDCGDPNDCTLAALEDIQDFDLGDILDIAQFMFILMGDIFQFFTALGAILVNPFDMILSFLFVIGWGFGIVSLFL